MNNHITTFKNTALGDVVILGNGPSIDDVDFSKLVNLHTIGVNRSWRKCRSYWHFIPPADCYFKELANGKWSANYIFTPGRLENAEEKIRRLSITPNNRTFNFITMPCDSNERYNKKPVTDIFPNVGFTMSGVMAMELAAYIGFTTLHLVGFDGGSVGHFKTEDPRDVKSTGIDHNAYHDKLFYKWQRQNINVKVYNYSVKSLITTWTFRNSFDLLYNTER